MLKELYLYKCSCGVRIYTPKPILNICPNCSWAMKEEKIPHSHDWNQDK